MATPDLDLALRSPANKVVLHLDRGEGKPGTTVVAHVVEDFSFSVGNQWEARWQDTLAGARSGAAAAANLAANAVPGGDGQMVFQNLKQTVSEYMGSERLTFQIPLLWVATKPDDDVRKYVAELVRLGLPANGRGSDWMTRLNAPGNYAGSVTDRVGTVGIEIGTWFRTPPYFLLKTGSPTFSKTPLRGTGYPLWATMAVQFEAYRILTAGEVDEFWPGISGLSTPNYEAKAAQ